MELPSLVIWTYLKLRKRDFFIPKLVLRTMRVQKCGAINLMITNLIFGHWDAFCTNLLLWNPHSERKTCKDFIRKCCVEFTPRSPTYSQLIWLKLSNILSKWHHRWDQTATKFSICRLYARNVKSYFHRRILIIRVRKWICWALFACLRIFFILQIGFQSHSMIQMTADDANKKSSCVDVHMKAPINIINIKTTNQAIKGACSRRTGEDLKTKDQRLVIIMTPPALTVAVLSS